MSLTQNKKLQYEKFRSTYCRWYCNINCSRNNIEVQRCIDNEKSKTNIQTTS